MDDIIPEVVHHLRPRENADRRALAQLARTRRSFCVPALDILWESMDDVLPLLKILSSSLAWKPSGPASPVYTVHRPIFKSEWLRFQSYARRIHSLCPRPLCHIDSSVFDRLSSYLERDPLLPCLTSLTISWSGWTTFEFEALFFVSPSLRQVRVSIELPDVWSGRQSCIAAKFLYLLCLESVNLEHLTLCSGAHGAYLPSVAQAANLRELVLTECNISPSLLSSCAQLPLLTVFRVRLLERQAPDLSCCGAGPGFPALEVLDAMGDLGPVTELIKIITSPHLRSFSWTERGPRAHTRQDLYVLYSALSSRHSAALRELDISFAHFANGADDSARVVDALRPLLKLRALEKLALKTHARVSLASSHLHDMASSWPHLTALLIAAAPPGPTAPRLHSLAAVARSCPALAVLRLPGMDVRVDALAVPHRLQTLCICAAPSSLVADPAAVAGFLDGLFPEVEIEVEAGAKGAWEEAVGVQAALQRARRLGLGVVSGCGLRLCTWRADCYVSRRRLEPSLILCGSLRARRCT
ncbi:hypothetical protein SCP_0500090 [Sparassis crispa]|uniref:F-box domain-containing protein n=1 Tax=Sparassis crispa TaxID=139825 RepID=A0A401GLC2_9APHY|nr:hypothetical protein SCP_0500090 [Sparassis crispa]GBE82966.1 hypothetical protein SCP_0500090 [Sparassis crispa]